MTGHIVVLCTCGSLEEARTLARALVEARAAACVNIVPQLQSIYRWQGKVEEAQECLLLIKTRAALLDPVKAIVRRLHSYELPEIIALPVLDGLREYLDWIDTETASHSES